MGALKHKTIDAITTDAKSINSAVTTADQLHSNGERQMSSGTTEHKGIEENDAAQNSNVPSFTTNELLLMVEVGYLFLRMNRYEEAAEVFEGLIVLAPENPGPYLGLGNVLQFEKPRAAIKQYKEALKLSPNEPAIYAYIGEALLFDKKVDEAVKHFHKAIEIGPGTGAAEMAKILLEFSKRGAPSA